MTTPSTERKAGPLLGTGAQTTWPFTFKVFAATDIAVTIADSLGVETALVYGVDYTVTLNANQETSPGGTVTYPISGSPLPTGSRLVIVGNLPYDQPLDLPSGGNFSPLAIENQLDRMVMQIQQLREQVGRAVQVRTTANADVVLPPPSANELIGWDPTGNNLQNFALGELATAVAYATMRYDTFTGDGVETQFTLTADPVTLANLDVAISGVTQVPGSDYSLLNGVLVFASAPPNGAEILARYGKGLVNVGGDSSDIRFLQAGTGAVDRTAESKLREAVSVLDFGASTAAADNKTAFEAALTFAVAQKKALHIPAGTYNYSGWTGLDQNNITIFGDGSSNTVLKYTGTGNALLVGTTAGFRQGVNLSGFTVEGNANVTAIIRARAIARSQWSDINVREANSATGIGFVFQGCMLSKFDFLVCSQDRQAMTSPPYEGINIEALSPYGNCSNNTFTNLYPEGAGRVASTIEIGLRISGGDQNVFIAGSPESCGTYGLLVGAGSRYNTFIGVGFENLNATGADVGDGGISSRYINCYASEKFVLQGRSASVEGGYFERIQIDVGAVKNRVQDVLVNGWSTGAGGFVDNGTATEWKNIYDADTGAFIYPLKDRVGLSFTAFPQSWVNNTGQYVEVVMNGATISGVSLTRNGISWDLTPGNGPFLVAPADTITFAGSGIPTKFWAIPHNGFQG